MTCHLDDCTVAFTAYCQACRWDGPEHPDVQATVADCNEHNRKQRHASYNVGYAHVRVVHHHPPLAEVTS